MTIEGMNSELLPVLLPALFVVVVLLKFWRVILASIAVTTLVVFVIGLTELARLIAGLR